jgi:mitochondrial fission protein ELM1
VWLWDGTGENPYFDLLAASDALLVTADSISMVSEAAALGRPVYLARLPGKPGKYGAFLDRVVARGSARWFEGTLDGYAQVKLDFAPAIDAVRAELKRLA